MKKTLCILFLCFLASQSFARMYYYCGANGYCFQVNEFTYVNGNFGYSVTYVGMCSGGPFVYNCTVLSPQDPGTLNTDEGSGNVYTSFSNAPDNNYQITQNDIDVATKAASSGTVKTVWLNPDKINWSWAQTFAMQQGQSVFALTLNGVPFHGTMSFDVWSVVSQNVQISLINQISGRIDWTSSLSLSEAKNQKRDISYGNLTGLYSLEIKSDMNSITRTVTLN
jgi:hypothetical protein